jgi:hypothetical protein
MRRDTFGRFRMLPQASSSLELNMKLPSSNLHCGFILNDID